MLRFTPFEKEVILHRLAVPDAIIDCLTDDNDEFMDDDIGEVIDKLETHIQANKPFLEDTLTDLQKAILADCVDGSTWVGCMIGNETPQRIGTAIYHGTLLAHKLSEVLGFEVQFPRH